MGLLKLVNHLNNPRQACRTMGYSRDPYYRIKDLYDTGGEAALIELSRRKLNHKNRVSPEIEEKIVEMATEFPAYVQQRASNEIAKRGITISTEGIEGVWLRYDLANFKKRLKALEAKVAQGRIIFNSQD